MMNTFLNSTIKKANVITNLLEMNSIKQEYVCTMLLLWHPSIMNWIKVPCNMKVLDKGTVFCSLLHFKNSTEALIQNQMLKARDLSALKYSTKLSLNNIFYCKDGTAISVMLVCDGKFDCIVGNDEFFCKCSIRRKKILNSTKCVSKCQKPTCRCDQPFEHFYRLGCKPFIDNNLTIKESLKNPDCSSKSIHCK